MLIRSKRLLERKKGVKLLEKIVEGGTKSLIIHYSCESFVTTHGKTPRITSISIRNIETAQTKSFSIHLQAQFEEINFNDLSENQYDAIEKNMLAAFYKYVEAHKDCNWVHWNMRDSNYGFEAIANRYRILGGESFAIDDDRKIDFPRVLALIYTLAFEKNKPRGRLMNLAERNDISLLDALKGDEEARAFENKAYLELHKSTLRKVDLIHALIQRTSRGELKVKANSIKIYGLSPAGIVEIVKNSWILLLIWSILMFVLGAALEPIIQKILGTAN